MTSPNEKNFLLNRNGLSTDMQMLCADGDESITVQVFKIL